MQRKVVWVNLENVKVGKVIGVVLNDIVCRVLRDQIGKYFWWVFVYMMVKYCFDGILMFVVRKMCVDDNNVWCVGLKKVGIEDFCFYDFWYIWVSWLIQFGVLFFVLQEMGGWESIEMVCCYVYLVLNYLIEYVWKIDVIFGVSDINMI